MWSQQWAGSPVASETGRFHRLSDSLYGVPAIVSTGVIGRSFEFSALAKFLQSAGVQPSALVIEGEAGIGKTTLWLAAVEQAREHGFQVMSARVGQNETVLAYAALADLLGGVDPTILTRLPEVQRSAVDGVLLRTTSILATARQTRLRRPHPRRAT
jgi:hypothetical protein